MINFVFYFYFKENMRYISIDIETTGLHRENDQIIEFGAILEDTNNPLSYEDSSKFHVYLKYDRYSGGAYALAMNQKIFDILAKNKDSDIIPSEELIPKFMGWLSLYLVYGSFTVAGKNFRDFDYEFLINHYRYQNVEWTWDKCIKTERRVLDPAVLFWNPLEDKKLPSQDECLVRAGIDGKVDHTALGDAWQVIQLLRTKYVT